MARTGTRASATWTRLVDERKTRTDRAPLVEAEEKIRRIDTEIAGLEFSSRTAPHRPAPAADLASAARVALRQALPAPAGRTDADGRFIVRAAPRMHIIVISDENVWFSGPAGNDGPLILTERNWSTGQL